MTTDLKGLKAACGQSIWVDNLSRTLIRDGILRRYIEEDGVSGVTSNPSIFRRRSMAAPIIRRIAAAGRVRGAAL